MLNQETDFKLLRYSFSLAEEAKTRGIHPFSAVLVDEHGEILLEDWAGVGRVVYGLSEAKLKELTGNHPENPTLALPCRVVFESGQREVEVIGPLLEEEAEQVQHGVW